MSSQEEQRVRRSLRGDQRAFRELVIAHSPAMLRLAFRLTCDHGAAEDVVQEAWIKAYRKLPEFDGRSSFGTWAHRITVNTAMDLLRRNRSRSRFETPDDAVPEQPASPSACPAERRDIQRQTLAAMQKLSDMERAAFTLRHFEGHSIKEICQLLGIRTSACKQAIFRAVGKMRAQLEPMVTP